MGLVQARGGRQHVVVGDALGPRPFLKAGARRRGGEEGEGPGRNSWLADKA